MPTPTPTEDPAAPTQPPPTTPWTYHWHHCPGAGVWGRNCPEGQGQAAASLVLGLLELGTGRTPKGLHICVCVCVGGGAWDSEVALEGAGSGDQVGATVEALG